MPHHTWCGGPICERRRPLPIAGGRLCTHCTQAAGLPGTHGRHANIAPDTGIQRFAPSNASPTRCQVAKQRQGRHLTEQQFVLRLVVPIGSRPVMVFVVRRLERDPDTRVRRIGHAVPRLRLIRSAEPPPPTWPGWAVCAARGSWVSVSAEASDSWRGRRWSCLALARPGRSRRLGPRIGRHPEPHGTGPGAGDLREDQWSFSSVHQSHQVITPSPRRIPGRRAAAWMPFLPAPTEPTPADRLGSDDGAQGFHGGAARGAMGDPIASGGSWTLYTAPVSITVDSTPYARATKVGFAASPVLQEDCRLDRDDALPPGWNRP